MGNNWPGSDWPGSGWQDRDDNQGGYRRRQRRGPGGPGGPPAWLQEIFGAGQASQPAPRGPRVRRGDVRTAIIDVLHRAANDDESTNGYQVIQQIADLSGGEWRPSPGSVYPTIQQLQDEGLVESDDDRGRRTVRLTEEGMAWASAHTAELAEVWAPFERAANTESAAEKGEGADIKSEVGQVVSAVWQLVTQGSEQQRRAALGVLVETRQRLYGILGEGRDGADRKGEDR